MKLKGSYKLNVKKETVWKALNNSDVLKNYSPLRLQSHFDFVQQRENEGKTLKYINTNYSTPVVTKQEINLTLPTVLNIHTENDCLHTATYLD